MAAMAAICACKRLSRIVISSVYARPISLPDTHKSLHRFSTTSIRAHSQLPDRFGFITAQQITHQVKGQDNFDGEEPPKVAQVVAEALMATVPVFRDGKWIPGKINPRELKKIKNRLISEGYYWPEKPLRDRNLDMVPKGRKQQIKKRERLILIEENMKKMPEMVAEYKRKCREERAKKREAEKASKIKELKEIHDNFQLSGEVKQGRAVKKK